MGPVASCAVVGLMWELSFIRLIASRCDMTLLKAKVVCRLRGRVWDKRSQDHKMSHFCILLCSPLDMSSNFLFERPQLGFSSRLLPLGYPFSETSLHFLSFISPTRQECRSRLWTSVLTENCSFDYGVLRSSYYLSSFLINLFFPSSVSFWANGFELLVWSFHNFTS